MKISVGDGSQFPSGSEDFRKSQEEFRQRMRDIQDEYMKGSGWL